MFRNAEDFSALGELLPGRDYEASGGQAQFFLSMALCEEISRQSVSPQEISNLQLPCSSLKYMNRAREMEDLGSRKERKTRRKRHAENTDPPPCSPWQPEDGGAQRKGHEECKILLLLSMEAAELEECGFSA